MLSFTRRIRMLGTTAPAQAVALLLLLPVLHGCTSADGESAAAGALEVRDSAGVRIAENRQAVWQEGAGWRVADAPTVEIGMAEGAEEYLLSGVTSVIRTTSGEILVANGASQQIRFYDSDGRHIRSVGRRGGGPGEFQRISWIAQIRGDTILAYDPQARCISVLSPDGDFIGERPLEELGSFPLLVAPLNDGSLVAQLREFEDSGGVGTGTLTGNTYFLRLSTSGALLDTILDGGPHQQYRTTRESSNGAMHTTAMPVLFGATTVAAVAGDSVFLGNNDRFQLGLYAPDGDLRALIRRELAPRPVTDEVLGAAARESAEQLETIDDPAVRELFREARENRPHAETLPFFIRALVDEVGNLWLMEFAPPGAEGPARWTVFDAEGRMLGDLTFPDRFAPAYIGDDFVLGVARDELDVQRVRLHPILKDRASPVAGSENVDVARAGTTH